MYGRSTAAPQLAPVVNTIIKPVFLSSFLALCFSHPKARS
jgi:hypothetical protein